MSPITWEAQDLIEPIADSTIEGIANLTNYNVLDGCGATYSGVNMDKTIAAGTITHNGVLVAVAGGSVSLVSDPTNPRWTYTGINSGGTAVIVSGSAAATPTVPESGDIVITGLDLVQAAQTIANNITYKLDKRVLVSAKPVLKYVTATQTFSASTSFVDVVAAGSPATMSFPVAANGVYVVTYRMPLTYGGTGGIKFQLTGPAAPTAVAIMSTYTLLISSGPTDNVILTYQYNDPTVTTAFSTPFNALNSSAGATAGTIIGGMIVITAVIRNGSTAGTVTLQGAQNSANSTSVIGLGATMTAQRAA